MSNNDTLHKAEGDYIYKQYCDTDLRWVMFNVQGKLKADFIIIWYASGYSRSTGFPIRVELKQWFFSFLYRIKELGCHLVIAVEVVIYGQSHDTELTAQ